MGWVWLAFLAAGAMTLMAVLGVRSALWSFVGAALMLGAAGYAWQGSPALGGSAPDPRAATPREDPGTTQLRDEMVGRFTLDAAYLVASDAMGERGDDRSAIRVLLGGIGKLPNSYALWTALGTAYARHDAGQVSPAARFAFARAKRLAPAHPAPPFFEGLAHLRAGDFAAARPYWVRALALTPNGVSYRRELALRLALLDRLLAMQQPGPPPR